MSVWSKNLITYVIHCHLQFYDFTGHSRIHQSTCQNIEYRRRPVQSHGSYPTLPEDPSHTAGQGGEDTLKFSNIDFISCMKLR